MPRALSFIYPSLRSLWQHSVKYGGSALAHMNLGLALIDLGQRSEGLTECLVAVSLDPNRAHTRYWMGKAYEKLGRPDEQAREAAKASRAD
jgi:tetratricopeptide (TPR) repeat protein